MFIVTVNLAGTNTVHTVKRSAFKIGADSSCHVVIPELYDRSINIQSDLGSNFVLKNSEQHDDIIADYKYKIVYDSLEVVVFKIDYDLSVKNSESVDKASARILKQALTKKTSKFPALMVRGEKKYFFSMQDNSNILIGRSEDCELVLETPDISGKHCKISHENGNFYVEDLGSTNGTFVNRSQVSGKILVPENIPVILGLKNSIICVNSQEELEKSIKIRSEAILKPDERRFPVLVSVSEIARPARLVIPENGIVTIGRDPKNDIWLGVPYVSRKHCEISLKNNQITVTDKSTNGTVYNEGKLTNGNSITVSTSQILKFGDDITIGICFNDEQERVFFRAKGNPDALLRQKNVQGTATSQNPKITQVLEKEFVESAKDYSKNKLSLEELSDFYKSLSSNNKLLLIGVVLGLFMVLAVLIFLILSMV